MKLTEKQLSAYTLKVVLACSSPLPSEIAALPSLRVWLVRTNGCTLPNWHCRLSHNSIWQSLANFGTHFDYSFCLCWQEALHFGDEVRPTKELLLRIEFRPSNLVKQF